MYKAALDAGSDRSWRPQRIERWPVTIGFVKDPDGYLVELVQRHPWPDGDDTTHAWLGQYCINVTDLEAAIAFYETPRPRPARAAPTSRTRRRRSSSNPAKGGKVQLAQQMTQDGPIDMGTAMWKLYVYTDDCQGLYDQAVGAGLHVGHGADPARALAASRSPSSPTPTATRSSSCNVTPTDSPKRAVTPAPRRDRTAR